MMPGGTAEFTFKTPEMLTHTSWVDLFTGGRRPEPFVNSQPDVKSPAHWPEMDDVPPTATSYVSTQPQREWQNIDDLLNRLRLDPTAKAIIEQAAKDGVRVEAEETDSGGRYNPETKKISIDPRVFSTDQASAVLLYELLRHKYRDDALKLNNRARDKADPITRDEYATECEKLSYSYLKEHHKIAGAAFGKGTWPITMDSYRDALKPETGEYRTFELYLDKMKMAPLQPAGTPSHYDNFRNVFDLLRMA